MKKSLFLFIILFIVPLLWKSSGASLFAQQLPYYTQFKTNMFMLNPAIAGTKRTIDARLNDRIQWVGYDGAPRTLGFSLHGRFKKGKMGAGMSFIKDEIGPSKQTSIIGTYAYHIRFPDAELSIGASGSYTKYILDASKITLHNTQDPAVYLGTQQFDWVPDANFGIYLYNDRFHVGASVLHLVQSKATFNKKINKNDTSGIVKYIAHTNFSVGYNYSSNPDYVMENTLYVNYVIGAPASLNYTVRVHYLSKVFLGASIRPKDAVALQLGATFLDNFQVSYSYDILTSKLKPYSHGTHEIMISFSNNIHINKSKFIHQRYAYMF